MLLKQDVYAEYLGSVEDFGISDVVGPLHVQDASLIAKVKNVEMTLMSSIKSLRHKEAC